MEKEKATKVGCQACKKNQNIQKVQNFVFIFGGLFFILAIIGLVSLVRFLFNLF